MKYKAYLMLLRERYEPAFQLTHEFAVAAQIIRSNLAARRNTVSNKCAVNDGHGIEYLATCVMPQVVPIYLELAMIVHMNKFMHNRVFHMLLMHDALLADFHHASIRPKATGTPRATRETSDILRLYVVASPSNVLKHKCDGWAYNF